MTRISHTLLEVRNLKKYYTLKTGFFGSGHAGTVKAVDDVSFDILKGETLGLVGESGSGKTTIGRSILRAITPTNGSIKFQMNPAVDKVEMLRLKGKELKAFRKHTQMIFQDPYSSLNPRMTVRDIIAEPLVVNKLAKGSELNDRVREVAKRCRLNLEHYDASHTPLAEDSDNGLESRGHWFCVLNLLSVTSLFLRLMFLCKPKY